MIVRPPRAALGCKGIAHICACLFLACVAPASAGDPLSLKDILSKAQTEAETKAVNDLIDKLRGAARPKAPASGAPSTPVNGPPRT
jgi:hypothetical protein